MYLVGDPVKTGEKSSLISDKFDQMAIGDTSNVENVISLLNNIVETACEHEPDLGLMRLINLMDLYRVYLQLANGPQSEPDVASEDTIGSAESVVVQSPGKTDFVSFEQFVKDSHLLSKAASAASLETGDTVSTPLPLTVSANA